MKSNRSSIAALMGAAVLAASVPAKADGIADAITSMADLATDVGAGSLAVITVALVFVGIKLGKRLLGKV